MIGVLHTGRPCSALLGALCERASGVMGLIMSQEGAYCSGMHGGEPWPCNVCRDCTSVSCQWLAADHQRTRGVIVSSHEELVKALHRDKRHKQSQPADTEARGWLVIGRSSGRESATSDADLRGA